MDFRKLLNTLNSINEATEDKGYDVEYRFQSNGSLVNFNIDDETRKLPYIDVEVTDRDPQSGESETVRRRTYGTVTQLEKLQSEDRRYRNTTIEGGSGDTADTNTSISGADAQAAADAQAFGSGSDTVAASDAQAQADADSGMGTQPGNNDGSLRLSDGRTFRRTEESQIELNRYAAQLYRRMTELLNKMNEGVSISLRGYLAESDLGILLLEALNDAEKTELKQVYDDLKAIADFEDDQGPLISSQNQQLLRDKLREAQPAIDQLTSAPAAGSGTNGETPPEAAAASDDSGDQDANVQPGQGQTAGSLEAFASSGKGGLANDPDEVDAIKELQQYLNDLGFDTGTVDGKYGRNTINGVKAFQEWMGAAVDGDAGPETIGVIVKLRSIRWGEGGSKNFVDWRNTMTRLEELIGKAGNMTDSKDMSSMRSIMEVFRRLDEALNADELQELQDIVASLQSAYDDAEFQQVLPQRVQQRFSSNMRSAQGVLRDNGADGDNADNQDSPQTDAELDADSADNSTEEPTAGPDDGTRGDQAAEREGEVVQVEGLPEGYEIRRVTARDYRLYGPDGQQIGRATGMANNDRLLLRRAIAHAEEQNATPDPDQAAIDAARDEVGSAADTVPADALGANSNSEEPGPRPEITASDEGTINTQMAAQRAWDEQFGQTHNPDGTPKAGADNGSGDQAAAAPAAQTTGDVTVSADAATRLERYMASDVDNMTDQQVIDMAKQIVADTEVFALLTPQQQEQFRLMAQ